MKRLPKGKPAQIMGSRCFQTMYTAEQMHKYVNKAVADEREACAKLIEAYPVWIGDNAKREIAAAIRARGQA